MFNYNMGCIWIGQHGVEIDKSFLFNYNMGCIWISYIFLQKQGRERLTITWDVFEYWSHNHLTQ